MKRIKGTKCGSNFIPEEYIKDLEKITHFKHIGTEVIKDSDLAGLSITRVGWCFGNENEGIIYVPFTHPDADKYDYSVCEIFMSREGE